MNATICKQSHALMAEDLNNDHWLDLIFFCQDTFAIHVLFTHDNGVFTTEQLYPTGYDRSFESIAVADIDKDHNLDLIALGKKANVLTILFNEGNASFKLVNTVLTPNSVSANGLVLADLNSDNQLDLVNLDYSSDAVYVLLGNGTGNFALSTVLLPGRYSGPSSVAVHDFNNDTYLDIMVGLSKFHDLALYTGYGNGTFDQYLIFSPGYHSSPTNLMLADLNGDSHMDIVFRYDQRAIGLILADENATFPNMRKITAGNATLSEPVAITDLNCDGHLDIVVAHSNPTNIGAFMGFGDGDFQHQDIGDGEIFRSWGNMLLTVVGDFNKDGYKDIVAKHKSSVDAFYILFNTCQCCLTGNMNLTSV